MNDMRKKLLDVDFDVMIDKLDAVDYNSKISEIKQIKIKGYEK